MPDMQRILRRAEGHWTDPRRPDERPPEASLAAAPEDPKPTPAPAAGETPQSRDP